MHMQFMAGLLALAILAGCAGPRGDEQEAARQMLLARDLEEEFDALPKAITRYGEIAENFSGNPSAKKAGQRKQMLERAQALLSRRSEVREDSLQALYESVLPVAPDYLALLKRLGTIYINQTHLAARAAAQTGIIEMKDQVMVTWGKQVGMWDRYDFRPIPADRVWQDHLGRHALDVAQMLMGRFYEYEQAMQVLERGMAFASGDDVKARLKVHMAYGRFRHGKTEDLVRGIALAEEALAYPFLADEDRARAYHVIGLCHTYIYQESQALSDLDAAIRALNECVNIDSGMTEARDLLKSLRQQRDRVANAS